MNNEPFFLRRVDGQARERVGGWDRPMRVWVDARRVDDGETVQIWPAHFDSKGLPLHCQWVLPTKETAACGGRDEAATVYSGHARVAAAGSREIWTDCDSVFLRAGGDLYLAGGVGRWEVGVWAAEERTPLPSPMWLTYYYAASRGVPAWPPGASWIEVVDASNSGATVANDAVLQPGVRYPISALGQSYNVLVRGFWRAGTVI